MWLLKVLMLKTGCWGAIKQCADTFLKERTDFPKGTPRCYRVEGATLALSLALSPTLSFALSHFNLFPAPRLLKITRLESE